MSENKDYVTKPDENGSINISEDVISIIAAAAAAEVDGVSGLSSGLGTDFAEKLGKKYPAKGVKISVAEDVVTVDASIMVRYGFTITEVAKNVQTAVAGAVESMSGLSVSAVNVHITGISFDK